MTSLATNYDDVLGQLRSLGLVVDALEFGRLVRCKVEGDREKRGWYALHEVRLNAGELVIFGSFGVWRGTDNNAQKIKLNRDRLSDDQLEAIRARIAEDKKRAEARRRREVERASARARAMWDKLPRDGTCDYLARKQVKAYGVRFSARGNMVIPMLDLRGRIHGLQVIYGDTAAKRRQGREKDYWPFGMSTKGMHFPIGAVAWIVLMAEGYATAASLHEATGYPVVVAFDAGNLLPVAQAIHKRYPWARVLVCADDDFLARCHAEGCGELGPVSQGACLKCGTAYGHGNAGVESAAAAALAIGGGWVAPVFSADRGMQKITDFNDLHQLEGLHAVRAQIEAKVVELGWSADAPTPRVDDSGGAGDAPKALKSLLTVDDAAVRYSLVYGGRGTLFDHQEHDLVPKADVLDMLEDHGWRDWKRHPLRKVVRLREVGFDPSGVDAAIKCNLWGGWPTKPKPGSCKALIELLEHLCAGEGGAKAHDTYQWVLRWLAYPIQHPGAKMKTALIFHGPQGVGKNMFFEAVMAIYGAYGRIVDQNAIEDKFNDWASKKLFLIADEVVARQELYHTKNKLKGFITGDWIRINPKNVAAHEERNHVNIVFLSNETLPLVLDKDDRRYTVIWTPEELSRDFYATVQAEMNAGGVEALHDYLLNLELQDFKPWTRPVYTQAKVDLITMSLDSSQRFIADWQMGETPYPFGPVLSMDLYRAYQRYCRENGVVKPREASQFLGYVGKIRGWTNQPRHVYEDRAFIGDTRPKRVVIPDEASLARVKKNRPEGQEQRYWLTDHIVDFAAVLEEQGRP